MKQTPKQVLPEVPVEKISSFQRNKKPKYKAQYSILGHQMTKLAMDAYRSGNYGGMEWCAEELDDIEKIMDMGFYLEKE